MSGIDRTEFLRRDCPTCSGNGYTQKGTDQEFCTACGGSGALEKEVPFKFDGLRSKEELAEIWGVDESELSDSGHSAGE